MRPYELHVKSLIEIYVIGYIYHYFISCKLKIIPQNENSSIASNCIRFTKTMPNNMSYYCKIHYSQKMEKKKARNVIKVFSVF
jgi:hypothetical protein